jgi:hypothetical protein
MLKLGELKSGDIVLLNDEGLDREGTVVRISHENRQALVDNGVQEFWYDLADIRPIPLDEDQLLKLGFEKEIVNGEVKYKKGSFRLLAHKPGDFSHLEMWWREDRRHFDFPLSVHDLQNLHLDMTKVPLDRP